jgi:hypothetical protein
MNAVAGDQVIARRTFLKGSFGALITPLAAEAQQAGKNVRIGVLSQGFPDPPPGLPLVRPLRALGWVEGQNLVFEPRFDEGRPDRLPTLAAELAGRNVDVIFTRGTPAALAAKATTATIPIVMIFVARCWPGGRRPRDQAPAGDGNDIPVVRRTGCAPVLQQQRG